MIYGGHFDPDVKKDRIKELELEMNNPNFWDDRSHSDEVLSELNSLKSKIKDIEELKINVESNLEIANLIKESNDLEMQEIISNDIDSIKDKLENILFFNSSTLDNLPLRKLSSLKTSSLCDLLSQKLGLFISNSNSFILSFFTSGSK